MTRKTNKWSKEELIIVWLNRFDKTSKEIAEFLPGRTPKSVKHVKVGFKKITAEDEIFIKENAAYIQARKIDEILNYPASTTSSYCIMKDISFVMRANGVTKKEIDILKKHQFSHTYEEIAEMLKTDESRIRNLASKLGLWKKFEWTEDKIKKATELLDEGKTLEEVDEYFGRKPGAARAMLNLNGLHDYVPVSYSSKFVPSKPEVYIIDWLNSNLSLSIPEKNRENKDYFWNIIPPYEVDIPFYIGEHKFAIEHDANHWHKSDRAIKNDQIKKDLLLEKGFHYFEITDEMYKHNNLKSMDPILDELCDRVREIIK